MELTVTLAIVTIIGSLSAIFGYILMRRKFLLELEKGKKREEELSRKVYEIAVLKEISDRIGHSLDASKVIEIISGSLGELLPYSTVSHMILSKSRDKVLLEIHVNEPVNKQFIFDVKLKMLLALSEMLEEPVVDIDIDERILGKILDEGKTQGLASYFNLPIVISNRVVGIINIASFLPNLYTDEETELLYRIARQASEAVTNLQEVLESEKRKLVQAVESLSDGILMVDVNFQLILTNKKLRHLLGVVDNPKMFDVANSLAGKFDLRSKMEQALSTNEELPIEEIIVKDKILQVSTAKVLDEKSQRAGGVVVLFHDITDAESLEKLREDFTAMMVHELRSPLTSIKSTVELLSSDLDKMKKEELKKYLGTVDLTSQTMLELVSDLLDVAKLEAGKFEVVCENGDLSEVVLDRVESFKPIAFEKNLKLEVDIAKDLPMAHFDKTRFKQVISNLISNSLKYTQTGEVKVKVAPEIVNGIVIDILVSVSDTGIGIEPELIDKLFSRFGQLGAGMKMAGNKSSGLGLYVAKGIVEASGGKIWAESAGEGKGSKFSFTVPLASGDSKMSAAVDKGDFDKLKLAAKNPNARNFSTDKVGRA